MAVYESITSIDIFVLCGELSGDKLGFDLLKDLCNTYKVEGVLGPHLRLLNIKELLPMDDLSFIGLKAPIRSLRKIFKSVKIIRKHIKKTSPKIVLLIDAPDLNLRLAKKLRKDGFKGKLIQLVCPSIWAWRPKRKATLEKYYDHLLCLFPHEKELFKNSPLSVSYIGHPLRSINAKDPTNHKSIIALFPGSRKSEISAHLPTYLKACEAFPNYKIHVSVAKLSLLPLIRKYTEGKEVTLCMPDEKETLIRDATFALAKTGTINLELALHHLPQISCYKLSKLEQIIFDHIFRLHLTHYSLPNILMKKRVIPELIAPFASLKNITQELFNLVNDPYILPSMQKDYAELSSKIKHSVTEDGSTFLKELLIVTR